MFAHEQDQSGKTDSTTPGSEGTLASENSYLTPRSSTTPTALSQVRGSLPAIDEQVAKVMELSLQPLKEGQKGFVVSMKWLSRVLSRASGSRKETFEKKVPQKETSDLSTTLV
jgi:ubiquitin carboxyl-terminal hydrolase 4/11/15